MRDPFGLGTALRNGPLQVQTRPSGQTDFSNWRRAALSAKNILVRSNRLPLLRSNRPGPLGLGGVPRGMLRFLRGDSPTRRISHAIRSDLSIDPENV